MKIKKLLKYFAITFTSIFAIMVIITVANYTVGWFNSPEYQQYKLHKAKAELRESSSSATR